ncbi:hypothetical protein BGZ47_008295 [Haplosporangium gracile]|nr:hypothetical protein BGZ47_008295 [Haplosporangium gracile]
MASTAPFPRLTAKIVPGTMRKAARTPPTLYPNTYPIPAAKDLKKCKIIIQDTAFPDGINKHVDALVFIIPHRNAYAREAFEVLWDIYLQRLCSYDYEDHDHRSDRFARLEVYARDAVVFEAIQRDGLTVNGTRHMPITPTPPSVDVWKVNFRYIPYYYSPRNILNLFNEYGTVMEIGMYYMDPHRGRHYTQDGYVLYKRCSQQEHQDMGLALPSQIEVGAKKPITVDVAGLHHKNRRKGKRRKPF